MQSSGFDTERLDAGMSKVGQILIEIERIILGTKKLDNRYRARHRAGMDEEVDMDGQDITHTTGYVKRSSIDQMLLKTKHERVDSLLRNRFITNQFVWWTTGRISKAKVHTQLFNFSTEAMVFHP